MNIKIIILFFCFFQLQTTLAEIPSASKVCIVKMIDDLDQQLNAKPILKINDNFLTSAKKNIPDDAIVVGEVHYISPFELRNGHERTMSNSKWKKMVKNYKSFGGTLKEWTDGPVLYVVSDGRKFVVDGNHRYKAARITGIKEIPAVEVKLPFRGFETVDDLELGPFKW